MIRAASPALEPVLLAGKPLPFVQVQLFFWKAAERCRPLQDGAVLRDLPASQPCAAAWGSGEEDLGLGKEGGEESSLLPCSCGLDAERGWTNRENPASDPSFLTCQCLGHFSERSKMLVYNQVPDVEGLVAQLLPW